MGASFSHEGSKRPILEMSLDLPRECGRERRKREVRILNGIIGKFFNVATQLR
jgi:hypothetical protein